MQNDLISRSALLENFNSTGANIVFDLPVKEVLGEDIDLDDFATLVQDAVMAYRTMVIAMIEEQSTTFNVEKVVQQLKEELKRADEEKERCAKENSLQFDSAKGYATGISNALDIVRNGGKEYQWLVGK